MPRYQIPVWKMCEEAAKELPEIFSPIDIIRKVHEKYPEVNRTTIRCQVIAASPNHPSSKHYPTSHRLFYYLGNGRFRFLKPDDKIIEKATNFRKRVDRIMVNKKIEEKIDSLIKNLDLLLRNFKYREGPELYFYKRVISEVKNNNLSNLLKNDYFIELIYATLVSWDMNTRRAKMTYFDTFKEQIKQNMEGIIELSKYKLNELTEKQFNIFQKKIMNIYSNLNVMKSRSKLVANSKILHFLLPNLIIPIDRNNTLMFFYSNKNASDNKFRQILRYSYEISKRVEFGKYFDNKWHTTIPKMIDNAIIGFMENRK